MQYNRNFNIKSQLGNARTCVLTLKHGTVQTPAFAPVATRGSIKTLTNEDLKELGVQLLMCNTYHLYLRPGASFIKEKGGLHKFMAWDKPVMTDSGGYQVFSLGSEAGQGASKFKNKDPVKKQSKVKKKNNVKITAEGVEFQSVYDGTPHVFTPGKAMDIQNQLGADIIFAFDECTPPSASYDYTRTSMERTHRWLKRCVAAKGGDQMLFGIIQGGQFKDLRAQSASFVAAQDTEGIGIGGSFGKKGMSDVLEWIHPYFPRNKPRHLLGIGTVPDILAGVKWGMDLFDCVVPQMIARMGYIHLLPQSGGTRDKWFSYRLTKAQFQGDDQPLDPNCGCKMCAMYSRAYVHHLFDLKEYTGKRIATYHNLYFILNLMKQIRTAIANGTFNQLYHQWMS